MTTLASNGLSVVDGQHTVRLTEHRPLKVQVVTGTAYLTREGDTRDYVMKPGESLCIEERGSVVVQGLPLTQIRTVAK